MKKYSTNYPLIFGIIFLIVGIMSGQITLILLFGVLPIVASVLMKRSDYKAKKQGKETDTERANRIYQEKLKASAQNAKVKKSCCARCGIDLSFIPARRVKKIGDKRYCDICEGIVLAAANNAVSPQTNTSPKKVTIYDVKQYPTCARCRRIVTEQQSVWVGNHRFCHDCTNTNSGSKPYKRIEDPRQRALEIKKLANVLRQVQKCKEEGIVYGRCFVCRGRFLTDSMIYIGGNYYCDVCKRIVIGTAKNTVSPQTNTPQKKVAIYDVKQHLTCARCKKIISEEESVWVGKHRFCKNCTNTNLTHKCIEDPMRAAPEMKKLANVLRQVQKIKEEESLYGMCFVCRRRFLIDSMIYINENHHCEDCYSFTYNRHSAEQPDLTDGPCQISYKISGLSDHTLLSRAVAVVDRLIVGGFVFHGASAGIEGNEIGLTDVVPHVVSYVDYSDFKIGAEQYIKNIDVDERKNSGDHINLEYSYIDAFLSRNTLKAHVRVEGEYMFLRWVDSSEKSFPVTRVFAENLIEDVYDNKCTLEQIDGSELDSAYLKNWN